MQDKNNMDYPFNHASPEISFEDDLEIEYIRKPEDKWDPEETCRMCTLCGSSVPMSARFCQNCGVSFRHGGTPIACVYAPPELMKKDSQEKPKSLFAKIFKRPKK